MHCLESPLWFPIPLLKQVQEGILIQRDFHALAHRRKNLEKHPLIGTFDLHLHLDTAQECPINEFIRVKVGAEDDQLAEGHLHCLARAQP